ncbi:MAG TPA: pitrilysin family protein [Bryobacteraceae bacterium]|mgnify:CR=1 FL=1|nr:pitrilysin family protein [Bryobacteraceae bacterium]HPU73670.1 pitrilysin family protein [Bryobacteraceae bacterium]
MKTAGEISVRILLVLALLASGSIRAAEENFKDIERRVTEFTLKNGMKFLVLERRRAPVASFLTYADVGAAQETKGITGLAHIFEHMAFKGTRTIGTKDYAKERQALEAVDKAFSALMAEKRKGQKADPQKVKELEKAFRAAQEYAGKFVEKNEFATAVERAGGRGLNASTGWDATRYYFSLPSNYAELWFYLESERFRDPVLREFYKERDVVMEERRMRTENDPIGRLLEEFLHAAYIAHPYGEPVVGHMSDLENITRADAEAFFKKYYRPSNLTAVIVGDVDAQEMRRLAEIYFGRLPSGPKPEPIRTVEPPQNAQRRVRLELQSQRILLMGYHKPDINHPDSAVYDVIGSLLSEGRSSRLYRSLVRDRKIAVQAEGFPGLPGQKYPGLFIFFAVPARGHTNEESEQAILEELERLKNEPVSQDELDGVKRRARANLLRGLADNSALAMQLADWEVLTGDWRNLFRQLDKINAVTPEDIQRVAKTVFVKNNLTVATIEPLETAQAK